MLGILVITFVSLAVLFLLKRTDALKVGFLPLGHRLVQFLIGLALTGALCALTHLLEVSLNNGRWVFNESIGIGEIIKATWWDVRSVLTEELVFRGVLLFVLIDKLGAKKGTLISAICFGVYHWFSFGVIGNLMPMIFVFVGTGLAGYAWAWAFAKTKSMWMPVGLHLGWNLVHNTVFSKGPLGDLLFLLEGDEIMGDWTSLLNFLAGLVLVPILVLLFVRFGVKSRTE